MTDPQPDSGRPVGFRRLRAVPSPEPRRRGPGLVALGPVSSVMVDALARRHGYGVVARYSSMVPFRPEGPFVDVLVDQELLGPLGEPRPGWMDEVDRIFILVDPDRDPIAAVTGPIGRAAKRMLDVVGGIAALVLFGPLIAAGALWVKLDSRGPAFFRQVRVGRDGRQFHMWKLRTMYTDVDDRHHREYVRALMKGQAPRNDGVFRVHQDPRITRAGRVLRRWSFDELPQFLNVVSGDMSLVGPRPNALHETAMYDGKAWQRLRVRPGVTGRWQVDARGLVPFEEMIELDLRYIEQWSFLGDVRLIFRTPGAVVGGEGAA